MQQIDGTLRFMISQLKFVATYYIYIQVQYTKFITQFIWNQKRLQFEVPPIWIYAHLAEPRTCNKSTNQLRCGQPREQFN